MVSGKPPRRSKAPEDPVTIDLTAQEAKKAEENGSPEASESDPASPSPSAEETSSAVPLNEQQTDTATDPWAPKPDETEAATAPPIDEQETSADTPRVEEAAPAPQPVRQSPATSTLVASGIFGGLVALALAGSMQYAGIVPGLGPDQQAQAPAIDTAELDALKAEVANLAARPAAEGTDPALVERVSALEESVANATSTPTADAAAVEALKTQLAGAEQAIQSLRAEIASNKQALEQSTTRLDEAERKLEEPRSDVEMARAIALSGLKTAIDRGGPFLSELDALKSVSPEDPAVAALTPLASNGVPSRSDLVRDFNQVADDILSAINQPEAGEGWTDRLLASARSLVKVRPVGNVEGETPEAIVARVENKLQNGDLKGAALEWETLPEAGKQPSSDFATKLKNRIEAEERVASALSQTVAGNGG
ncbi:MAG: COG4223 family protein [Rhizobiales bacterium]|nr:COG4223 family protein [Hyphomicrobiales bacterium]